jgi:hypothetical protein
VSGTGPGKEGPTKSPQGRISPTDGGCDFVHDPELPPDSQPTVWCPEIAPGTVIFIPAPEGFDGVIPLDLPFGTARIAEYRNGEDCHLILADIEGPHRLWLHGIEALRRPAILLPLDAAFDLRVEAMERLYRRLRGRPAGPLPRALQLTAMRRARLILLLHTLDFRLAGASPREIAAALLDKEAAALPAIEWKSSATRRKANHLIHDAQALMNGGYRKLLWNSRSGSANGKIR